MNDYEGSSKQTERSIFALNIIVVLKTNNGDLSLNAYVTYPLYRYVLPYMDGFWPELLRARVQFSANFL